VGTIESDDEMRVRVEVFNSVEGCYRLMAIAGWLRFVCTNGLIIGTALLQLKQQHRQQLEIEELGRRVGEAIESAHEDPDTRASVETALEMALSISTEVARDYQPIWRIRSRMSTL